MKICLINNLFKPYHKGGAERIIELQAENLSSQGNQVFIISSRPYVSVIPAKAGIQAVSSSTLDSRLRGNDREKLNTFYLNSLYFNLNKIPLFLRIFWHIWDLFDFITAKKIKKILQNEKPDLVITHNLKGLSYLIPKIIKNLKIKHEHYLHDIQLLHPSGLLIYGQEKKLNTFSAKIYQKINQKLFKDINKVISPSRWLLALHLEKGFFKNTKTEIINLKTKKILETKIKINKKNLLQNFLYAGQIEDHKGILFLIKVFKEFLKQNPKIKLLIAGDGSQLKKAQILAQNNQGMIFLGKLDKIKLKKIMKKSDCLIVPSLCYENAPTVILEAQELGLPVLASRLGGIPELLENKFLFKPKDEKDLKKKIKSLILKA